MPSPDFVDRRRSALASAADRSMIACLVKSRDRKAERDARWASSRRNLRPRCDKG
jgi:hypothetical protein